MSQKTLPEANKLRWMCRRGLLELDLVLTKILNEKYQSLSHEHKELFIELLDEPDTDLLAWLLGQVETPSNWSHEKRALVEQLSY